MTARIHRIIASSSNLALAALIAGAALLPAKAAFAAESFMDISAVHHTPP